MKLNSKLTVENLTLISIDGGFETLLQEITDIIQRQGYIFLDSTFQYNPNWNEEFPSIDALIQLFHDERQLTGSNLFYQIYPSTQNPPLPTTYPFEETVWQNGEGIAFPEAQRIYLWLTPVEVSTGDTVGYSLDLDLKKEERYRLSFQYYNPYEPTSTPSVYLKVLLDENPVWQYGLGEGKASGWFSESVILEPTKDDQKLEFSIITRESPDQYEWGKYSMTMFRHIKVEPLP